MATDTEQIRSETGLKESSDAVWGKFLPAMVPVGAVAFMLWGIVVREQVEAYRWGIWVYWGAWVLGTVGALFWIWVKENPVRQALGLLLIVTALLGGAIGIVLAAATWQFALVRIGFILVACLVPAMMYYLFIVSRKGSLLNEFIANLDRLGLLQQKNGELTISRTRRVEAYLQKFEATFGPIEEPARNAATSEEPKMAAQAAKLMRVSIAGVFLSEAALPVLIVTVIMALFWVVTLPPVKIDVAERLLSLGATSNPQLKIETDLAPWWQALRPNLFPATAAFLGAYFFSLQLLFRRYLRRDIRPNIYVGVALRILLAVTGIWIFQGLAQYSASTDQVTTAWLIAWGFILGVFPRVLLQFMEGVARKLMPTALLPSVKSDLPISDLDGLTLWHEARLEDEDIENVPNMASADLPELMINTRFPAHRVIDWVDQAILYTCIGSEGKKERRDRLRLHGIRTATALTEAYRQASEKDKDSGEFERILGTNPRSEIRSIVDVIETMPNTRLVRTWRGLQPDGFRNTTPCDLSASAMTK
jgi:hypothetical protein